MIKISTSILSSDDRINCVKTLNTTNSDYIHIDVMDNKFVPNYQLPLEEVEKLKQITKKLFDIHLMMEDPEQFIKKITKNKVDSITIHTEINKDIDRIIELIKSYNCKVGLAIKPNTDISAIDKYIHKIDKVLIMSVEPGLGGQKFIEKTIDRIIEIKKKYTDIIVEVDGGINKETIENIKYIADIAVVGVYITKNKDMGKAINTLKK